MSSQATLARCSFSIAFGLFSLGRVEGDVAIVIILRFPRKGFKARNSRALGVVAQSTTEFTDIHREGAPLPAGARKRRRTGVWQHGIAGRAGRGSRQRLGALLDEHGCSSRNLGMGCAAPVNPSCHLSIVPEKQGLPRYGVTLFNAFGREKWNALWLGLELPCQCPLSGVKRTLWRTCLNVR